MVVKKSPKFAFAILGIALFVFAGCKVPSFSGDALSVLPPDSGATDKIPSATTQQGVDENEVLDPIGDFDFMMGFDASYVDIVEEKKAGFAYKDTNGEEKDVFLILRNHGINTIRLRLWVDPTNAETNGIVSEHDLLQGDNTLERTIRLAKRVKNAGLKIMLDFHYSDIWADPGKQVIPYSWQNITTSDAMAEKISSYTTEVLEAMKAEDVAPDYVQVGNEIDSGILLHTKVGTNASASVAGNGDNLKKYLVAGCQAVRNFASANEKDIKIILHVTNRSGKIAGIISTMSANKNLYDIIGISFYPWESGHRTVKDLQDNIKLVTAQGKIAVVAETSMIFYTDENNPFTTELGAVKNNMIDPDTNAIYSDIEIDTATSLPKGSVSNQEVVIRHIIEATKAAGGSGVCAWGGDMAGNYKWSFFEWPGKANSSIDVFKTSVR